MGILVHVGNGKSRGCFRKSGEKYIFTLERIGIGRVEVGDVVAGSWRRMERGWEVGAPRVWHSV